MRWFVLSVLALCLIQQRTGLARGDELDDLRALLTSAKALDRSEALAEVSRLGERAAPLMPDIVAIVEAGEYGVSDDALRLLAKLKSTASPAIPVLCTLLGQGSQASRALAAEALVDPTQTP